MNCGNCGAPLLKNDKFCGTCGALVPKQKNNRMMKILIPILASAILIGGGVGALFATGVLPPDSDKTTVSDSKKGKDKDKNKDKDKDKDKDKKPTSTPKPTATTKPTATPKPTATSTPTPTEVPEPTEDYRTIMIYMIGANLESEAEMASGEIDEMLAADIEDGTHVILQTGGATKWKNPNIKDGEVQRWSIEDGKLVELESLGKVNMSDEANFEDFLDFSMKNYPAENYTLVLWDHGGGTPIGFGWDELYSPDYITCYEIGDVLEDLDLHCDAFVTNACLMCSLEMFMSIKDNVDYAVASESVLLGNTYGSSGIDYTNWLALASQQDVSTQDFCEAILDDYIDFLHSRNWEGSMSVIRMDRIQEVYNAYVDFIADINDNYDYVTYFQARNMCGDYEDTDSVDISEFASIYESKYSTALQNAVSNAVVRTKSDYPSGHGITAYSPIDWVMYSLDDINVYSLGRTSFTELNYDSRVIEFYDKFVSQIWYEAGYGDYASANFDWYIAPDGGSSSGNYYMDEPEVIQKNGKYAVELSEDDWSVISSVRQQIYIKNADGTYTRVGVNDQFTSDSDGDIVYSAPESWLYVNGYLASSVLYSYDITEDGWSKIYFVAAYVNGEEALLIIKSNQDDPDGTVVGYCFADFDAWTWDDGHNFVDGDKIELVQLKYDTSNNPFYEIISDEMTLDELSVTWESLQCDADAVIGVNYYITDVYGNMYQTELIGLY